MLQPLTHNILLLFLRVQDMALGDELANVMVNLNMIWAMKRGGTISLFSNMLLSFPAFAKLLRQHSLSLSIKAAKTQQ
jgi:hypothetical protein